MTYHPNESDSLSVDILAEKASTGEGPVEFTSPSGRRGVVISKEDWDGLQETLYLKSVAGIEESILSAIEEPIEHCTPWREAEW